MFARVVDNVAVDVSVDPAAEFHPDIARQFESVSGDVKAGWVLNDGIWSAPAVVVTDPVEPEVVYPVFSPVEFKLLFTSAERIKLGELRATDPILDDFFSILDDPRLTEVRLDRPSVQQGVEYSMSVLITAGVIADQAMADQRKSEILAGVAQ